jgi:hypothetical protein
LIPGAKSLECKSHYTKRKEDKFNEGQKEATPGSCCGLIHIEPEEDMPNGQGESRKASATW